jgi:hypothetical protein
MKLKSNNPVVAVAVTTELVEEEKAPEKPAKK